MAKARVYEHPRFRKISGKQYFLYGFFETELENTEWAKDELKAIKKDIDDTFGSLLHVRTSKFAKDGKLHGCVYAYCELAIDVPQLHQVSV